MQNINKIVTGCVLALTVACGGNKGGTMKVNVLSQGGASPTALSAGAASTSQLFSLKYYIAGISICEELSTSGTAFSNPTNCLEIYSNNDEAYETYGADAARADTTHYVDLADATARRALGDGITYSSGDAHAYNWGLITWYKPLKIKAEVTLADGTTLVTKDGTVNPSTSQNQSASLVGAPGESEEAIAVLQNGGTWIKFQHPFVITAEDVTAHTDLALDLVFNPEGLIKGWGPTSTRGPALQDSAGYSIWVPMLDLTPVAHKASETVTVESYLFTTPLYNLRMEIYSLTSDADRTIYGVDLKTVYTEATNSDMTDPMKVSYVVSNPDGTLRFEDWQHQAIIDNFTRLTTEGDTGTATLSCPEYMPISGCATTATESYSLHALRTGL